MGFLKKLGRGLGKVARAVGREAVGKLPGGSIASYLVSRAESSGVNRKRLAAAASRNLTALPASEKAAIRQGITVQKMSKMPTPKGPAKSLSFAALGAGGKLETAAVRQKRAARERVNQDKKFNALFAQWTKEGKPGKWEDYALANS